MECKLTLNGCKINWENAELIETLWNVNFIKTSDEVKELKRINRNIVECKYNLSSTHCNPAWELIETLWNVNVFLMDGRTSPATRINRNIVECKYVL